MNVRTYIFCISVFLCALCFLDAETFAGKRMLTFDLSYLSTGLKHNGYGLGANYEIQVFNFLSVRPGLSHMVLFPKDTDATCITVGVKVGAFFYPFFKGLEGPYLGGEAATDFCMFRGDGYENNETPITLSPILGWKFSVLDYVFFDVFCGYQFLMNKGTFSHESLSNYYGNKFLYGVKVKLNLRRIWMSISKSAKKNAAKKAEKAGKNSSSDIQNDEGRSDEVQSEPSESSASPETSEISEDEI